MRILFATDGSRPAALARDLVSSMPWPAGSLMRVVSVVHNRGDIIDATLGADFPVGLEESLDPVVRAHQVALDTTEREIALARPDMSVERFLLHGRAASVIVDEAREMAANLIVVGHRGHGPWESMLLGSVSAEVVDHAPCPVLVVRDARLGPVVFADDGSDAARTAEAALIEMPFLTGRPITVLSVADTGFPYTAAAAPGLYDQAMAAYADDIEAARVECAAIAAATAARLDKAGLGADVAVRSGDPAREIVEFARERGAGLIVLGTRGHTGLKRLLLGSCARNVLLHAPCSVLIVRARTAGTAAQAETRAGRSGTGDEGGGPEPIVVATAGPGAATH
jgi:nucleotide-binding universal stress UspA family protein